MISGLFCVILSYFSCYPSDCNNAINFFCDNKEEINQALNKFSTTEQLMAMSIVAPELSQFSNIFNTIEMRTLFVFYLSTGKSDFSVGYFQMKPSFIEEMEETVQKNKSLKKQYSDLTPKGSIRDKRRFRLNNLSALSGQLRYLCLFIEIAKQKTSKITFANDKEKLKYWATLYNSGFNLTQEEVKKRQCVKQFPHFSQNFNYSDIAVEFYGELHNSIIADTWQNMKLK